MYNVTGVVNLISYTFEPPGQIYANGQLLSITEYPDLYSAIGTKFGGDGETTFAVPDLGKTGDVSYVITPTPARTTQIGFPGQIMLCPFDTPPENWSLCNGSLQRIVDHGLLWSRIGNDYGGDENEGTFGLPDIPTIKTGQKAGSTLNYMICFGTFERPTPFIGDILYAVGKLSTAGAFTWHDCNGAALSIEEYRALYALIADEYGGGEPGKFSIPQLPGPFEYVRAVLGVSGEFPVRE